MTDHAGVDWRAAVADPDAGVDWARKVAAESGFSGIDVRAALAAAQGRFAIDWRAAVSAAGGRSGIDYRAVLAGRADDLTSLLTSLYGNGEQGAFYVPKPQVLGQQVLFQDAAGTTPVTAPGDPVGLMLDLSGNDNHATQKVAGSRPIYRTDGTRHWLEFDGVDDLIEANLGYNLVPGGYLAEALKRGDRTGSFSITRIRAASGANDYFDLLAQTSERLQFRSRALSQEIGQVFTAVSAVGSFGNTSPYVVEGSVEPIPGKVRAWIDVAVVGEADSNWPAELELGTAQLLLLGSSSPNRLFFGGCYMQLAPPQAERSALRQHLASLAGVTL